MTFSGKREVKKRKEKKERYTYIVHKNKRTHVNICYIIVEHYG